MDNKKELKEDLYLLTIIFILIALFYFILIVLISN